MIVKAKNESGTFETVRKASQKYKWKISQDRRK